MNGPTPTADWVDEGNTVSSPSGLQELVARLRGDAHHMRTGLARAAWGALHGRAWGDAGDVRVRPNAEEILHQLRMSAVPAGMTAKEATHRQALAALLAALDAVDEAALTVWLAHVNSQDPNRQA